MPLLLCISLAQGTLMRLSFIARALGVAVKEVKEEEWGQPLESLCGLAPTFSSPPRVRVGGSMAVMAGFRDNQIDDFLQALRRDGISDALGLKAVLTPHNRKWNCGQLYLELAREAASFVRTENRSRL